jgi:hypothetical protein
MENISHASQRRGLFILAVIMLLPVVPARSDTVGDKENGQMLRIPLELSKDTDSHGQGWKALRFTKQAGLQKPCEVLALCIISDGEHTRSEYQVTVKNIQLNPKMRKEQ